MQQKENGGNERLGPVVLTLLTGTSLPSQTQCQDLRKRKNLELQILGEPVRGWEGDSMKTLGHVAYMSQVHMQSGTNEVTDLGYNAGQKENVVPALI